MSPLLGLLTGLKLGNMGIVGAMNGGLCEPVLLLEQDYMYVKARIFLKARFVGFGSI